MPTARTEIVRGLDSLGASWSALRQDAATPRHDWPVVRPSLPEAREANVITYQLRTGPATNEGFH